MHQLCKSLETKPLQYSDAVYNRIHFIDAKGVLPLKPVPPEYIVNDLVSAWAFAELSTSEVSHQVTSAFALFIGAVSRVR